MVLKIINYHIRYVTTLIRLRKYNPGFKGCLAIVIRPHYEQVRRRYFEIRTYECKISKPSLLYDVAKKLWNTYDFLSIG